MRKCAKWQHLWAPARSFRMVPPRVDSLRYANQNIWYSRRVSFVIELWCHSYVNNTAVPIAHFVAYARSRSAIPRASSIPPRLASSLCSYAATYIFVLHRYAGVCTLRTYIALGVQREKKLKKNDDFSIERAQQHWSLRVGGLPGLGGSTRCNARSSVYHTHSACGGIIVVLLRALSIVVA